MWYIFFYKYFAAIQLDLSGFQQLRETEAMLSCSLYILLTQFFFSDKYPALSALKHSLDIWHKSCKLTKALTEVGSDVQKKLHVHSCYLKNAKSAERNFFCSFFILKLIHINFRLCSSINYPYPPHRRDFFPKTRPTPLVIPIKLYTYSNNLFPLPK